MQEILLDTYTIALPIILGYIVWLLKRTNKKCIQDTNFSPDEYPADWEDAG